MRLLFFLLLALCSSEAVFSQKTEFTTVVIPENLKENANSVAINRAIAVTINSFKSYTVSTTEVIKVLNEEGLKNISPYERYSKSTKIKKIDAKMYNSFGHLIKDFKQKDFKDQSATDGSTMVSDDRILALDLTPTEYPFILVYSSEVESENTAFIPGWFPITSTYESVLKSTYTLVYPVDLTLKSKEFSFEGYPIIKNEEKGKITYTLENSTAIKTEEYAPNVGNIIPKVYFGLERFWLEGVEGTAKSWKDFGLWMKNSFLSQDEPINEETKQKIIRLVGNETDPVKKAKIVYQFMQDKTRYVSIQLGIGGWKPMLANDVDRLAYGDCKALSNYTNALLKLVGVESYYTIIYGGNKRNIEQDIICMQGNHVILAIPNNNSLTFLECTSQMAPFGFEGDFTDDRYALIIKPDGGEIVKTKAYTDKDNLQKIKASYTISNTGELVGEVETKSKGIAYDNSYHIEKESPEKIANYYKETFGNLMNLTIKKVNFTNDKDKIEFTEKISVSATNYASIANETMIFPLNAFNQNVYVPKRYKVRNSPLEIARGYYNEDEIEITLPEDYTLDSKMNTYEIKDKFGEYKAELIIVSPKKLIYKRNLFVKKGVYDKTEYDNYRKFTEQIAKADNSKILLKKI